MAAVPARIPIRIVGMPIRVRSPGWVLGWFLWAWGDGLVEWRVRCALWARVPSAQVAREVRQG